MERHSQDSAKMNADCQMQPLDLSCPRGASPTPPQTTTTAVVVEPAEPPRRSTSPRTSEAAAPLNLTSSSSGSAPETPVASGSGPARKRFLTKYLHKDRGERASDFLVGLGIEGFHPDLIPPHHRCTSEPA